MTSRMDPALSAQYSSGPHSLSLVIPVFNEEENIPPLMEAIRGTVPGICSDYEIVFVDDASEDRSGEMLDAIAGTDRRVRVLHNERNKTLGGSLRAGFQAATKELILYFDADLPFDLKEIAKAIARLDAQGADFFSAYRTSRGGEGARRFLYSLLYNKLVDLVFHLGVRDVNFSFKLFKRSLLKEIRLLSEGSFINVEMLTRVRMAGSKVAQLPCDYHPRTRGRSTLSSFKVIWKILMEFARFFFRLRREKQERGSAMRHFVRTLCRNAPYPIKAHISVRSRTCPFEKIETYVPREGKILDLGCGFGFFDLWMFRCSAKRDITALDRQKERISMAERFTREEGSPVKFGVADYNDFDLGAPDAILLIDTLYLMSCERQKVFLARCAACLRPGGTLLIKEMNVAPRYKYFWLLFQEYWVARFEGRSDPRAVHIMPQKEAAVFLKDLGFEVETVFLDEGYFYPHILYRCVKQ